MEHLLNVYSFVMNVTDDFNKKAWAIYNSGNRDWKIGTQTQAPPQECEVTSQRSLYRQWGAWVKEGRRLGRGHGNKKRPGCTTHEDSDKPDLTKIEKEYFHNFFNNEGEMVQLNRWRIQYL
jgi:hypothetical protein